MRRNKDVSKSELRAQIVQPAKKEQNQPLILFFSYFAQFGISPYISVLCFYWEAQKPPSIPSNWRGPPQARGPQEQQGKKILGVTKLLIFIVNYLCYCAISPSWLNCQNSESLLLSPNTSDHTRFFNRLKLIKNILRSTMTDDRLCALAIISVENKIARSLDYD